MIKEKINYHYVKVLPFNIGNTPVVQLRSPFFSEIGNIHMKLEYYNPTGSIKDRAICAMVNEHLSSNRGNIEIPQFVLPSSGNAGISLAYITSKANLNCSIFTSSHIEQSKINLIKYFGGKLYNCDSEVSTGPGGWIYEALAFQSQKENSVLINQFDNKANVLVHQETTAPELANYFLNQNIDLDILFIGVGSGGTAEGILNFYKKEYPKTQVVALEPHGGIMHDTFHNRPTNYIDHRVEALSDRFIPNNIKSVKRYNDVHQFTDSKMEYFQKKLMTEEGLFVGETTGFVISAAIDYLKCNNLYGRNVALIATDYGYRYL